MGGTVVKQVEAYEICSGVALICDCLREKAVLSAWAEHACWVELMQQDVQGPRLGILFQGVFALVADCFTTSSVPLAFQGAAARPHLWSRFQA